MPSEPTVPQKVKFFTARDIFIAEELPLTSASAIQFDEWIVPLFKDITGIDRTEWDVADRLWAINSALTQIKQRRENGQIYVRLDPWQEGKFILSIVYPELGEQVAS